MSPSVFLLWAGTAGGIALLIFGGGRFVSAASALARKLGVSPMVVGMTVVAVGTSLPELTVTVLAALSGHPEVALGNVVGSNVANIGLILGITAIFHPLTVSSTMLVREYPLLVAATLALWGFSAGGRISVPEGAVLTVGFIGFLWWSVIAAGRERREPIREKAESTARHAPVLTSRQTWTRLALGLAGLLAGSRLLVWGAAGLARKAGVGELVIGLTLVAVGTSLPEMATSLIAAVKGEDDIAVGNVVGSNLFNTLGILGLSSLVRPTPVPVEAALRDMGVMALATLVLWPVFRRWRGRPGTGVVNRWEGLGLLAGYVVYLVVLFR